MRRLRISLLCVGLIAASALSFVWYLRSHGFSARMKPSKIEAYLARKVRGLAIDPAVRNRMNPVEVSELSIAEARDHFADHCATCHANDGSGRTMLGSNMFPPTPDLRLEDTQRLSDGAIFSIIQNGIRFTGMPGFGGEDEENWKLVHFIRHLPKLSPKELELMREVNNLDTEAPGHEAHGAETKK